MPDTPLPALNVQPLAGRVSEAEWETRVHLAAAFRVAYFYGWNYTINNHISARVPGELDHFVMNPTNLGWDEMTASCLIKAHLVGAVLNDTELTLAPAGQNFHSAILAAKPELNCVLHMHPQDGVVVSALKDGLMFVDQSAGALFGTVGYHDFEGLASAKDEGPRIVADLGDNMTMIMRNHGLLSVGRSVAEAFAYMQRLIMACETQVKLMATGGEINPVPDEVLQHTRNQMMKRTEGKPYGERAWPAMLRLADRLDPGYKT